MSKINLQAETTNSGEQEEQREKTDMLRSIGKQSGESVESLDSRKFFFSQRVVNGWNSLQAKVVNSESVNSFKNAYDRYYCKDMDNRLISCLFINLQVQVSKCRPDLILDSFYRQRIACTGLMSYPFWKPARCRPRIVL